jgi:hypothetical protein
MSPYRASLFPTVSLACLLCVWLSGGPFVAEVKAAFPAKPARTDAYGDPLPPGALMRLGTVRWRAVLKRRSLFHIVKGGSMTLRRKA